MNSFFYELNSQFCFTLIGNLDAKDGRKYEEKINELINRNEKQINTNIEYENNLNKIIRIITDEIRPSIERSLTNIDILNLISSINLFMENLNIIQDAITLSKLGIVSKNLLQQNELDVIYNKLVKQHLNVNSIHEALNYLESTVYYKEDTIYINIKIPIVKHGFERMYIYAIPNNGTEIVTASEEVLTRDNQTYAVIGKCLGFSNFICKLKDLKDISDDLCIPPLLRSQKGKCPHKEVTSEQSVKVVIDGTIITRSSSPITIFNTCSNSNHSAIGSTLINFENCTVTINGEAFENFHIYREAEVELMSHSFGLVESTEIRKDIKLHEIHELTIQHDEHIELLTRSHSQTHYFLIIICAIFVLSLVGVGLYIYCCYVKPMLVASSGANFALQAITGIEEGLTSANEETVGGRMIFVPDTIMESTQQKRI